MKSKNYSTITGWLFDVYPSKDNSKMIFWIRLKEDSEDGKKRYIKIEEEWQNYFYIVTNNESKLEQLVQNDNILSLISYLTLLKNLKQ